jgi:hypothetical protein
MNSRITRTPQGWIFLLHCGTSMRPTLVDSDLIEVHPYNEFDIDPGDIIAFQTDVGEDVVVHRVMKVDEGRIYTRGDHNAMMDAWVIKPSSVLGKVQAGWRGQKRIRIIGGRAGLIWSACLQRVRKLDQRISQWLHSIYRFLSKHGAIISLIPKRARPQLQTFISNGTAHYRLTLGNRMVGWYDEEFDVWRIKRPYRLFVCEGKLSEISSQISVDSSQYALDQVSSFIDPGLAKPSL